MKKIVVWFKHVMAWLSMVWGGMGRAAFQLWDGLIYSRWGAMLVEGLALVLVFGCMAALMVIAGVLLLFGVAWLAPSAVFWTSLALGVVYAVLCMTSISCLCLFIGLRYADSRPIAATNPDASKMFEMLLGRKPSGEPTIMDNPMMGNSPDEPPTQVYSRGA